MTGVHCQTRCKGEPLDLDLCCLRYQLEVRRQWGDGQRGSSLGRLGSSVSALPPPPLSPRCLTSAIEACYVPTLPIPCHSSFRKHRPLLDH